MVSATGHEPVTVLELTIVGADHASWADLQAIFGTTGSAGHCYCQAFKVRDRDWSSMTDQERRDRLRQQTNCDNARARATSGLVAYLGDEPVGWVAVEPGTALPPAAANPDRWSGRQEDRSDDSVWA